MLLLSGVERHGRSGDVGSERQPKGNGKPWTKSSPELWLVPVGVQRGHRVLGDPAATANGKVGEQCFSRD